MSDEVLWLFRPQASQVFDRCPWRKPERLESGEAGTHKPPDDPEQNQSSRRVAEDHMQAAELVGFGDQIRHRKRARQEPVEYAYRQVPHSDSVGHGRFPWLD